MILVDFLLSTLVIYTSALSSDYLQIPIHHYQYHLLAKFKSKRVPLTLYTYFLAQHALRKSNANYPLNSLCYANFMAQLSECQKVSISSKKANPIGFISRKAYTISFDKEFYLAFPGPEERFHKIATIFVTSKQGSEKAFRSVSTILSQYENQLFVNFDDNNKEFFARLLPAAVNSSVTLCFKTPGSFPQNFAQELIELLHKSTKNLTISLDFLEGKDVTLPSGLIDILKEFLKQRGTLAYNSLHVSNPLANTNTLNYQFEMRKKKDNVWRMSADNILTLQTFGMFFKEINSAVQNVKLRKLDLFLSENTTLWLTNLTLESINLLRLSKINVCIDVFKGTFDQRILKVFLYLNKKSWLRAILVITFSLDTIKFIASRHERLVRRMKVIMKQQEHPSKRGHLADYLGMLGVGRFRFMK